MNSTVFLVCSYRVPNTPNLYRVPVFLPPKGGTQSNTVVGWMNIHLSFGTRFTSITPKAEAYPPARNLFHFHTIIRFRRQQPKSERVNKNISRV